MHRTVITQKLTDGGKFGVLLLILGPLATGLSYVVIMSARSYYAVTPDLTWLYVVAIAGVMSTVIALPLLLVGRRYVIEREE